MPGGMAIVTPMPCASSQSPPVARYGTLDIYEARPDGPMPEVIGDDPDAAAVPSAYLIRAANDTSLDVELQAWVICLDVPG
jgi:hypothetical protein